MFPSVVFGIPYFPQTMQAPMLAHTTGIFHFNEGAGTFIHDTSGWGSMSNVPGNFTWVTGKYGAAVNMTYTTSNPSILVATTSVGQMHFDCTDRFGYFAWIKTSGGTSRNFTIIGDVGQLNDGLWYGSSMWVWDDINNCVGFSMEARKYGGGYRYYTGSTPVCDGEWHFCCVVSSGYLDSCFIYVDGNFDTVTPTATDGVINSIMNIWSSPIIGGRYWPNNMYDTLYEGSLDECGWLLFPSTFGETEIKQCMRLLYEKHFSPFRPH